MLNELWADWLCFWGGLPCFCIYGKARPEPLWRIIEVYATSRRNLGSGWPLWDGTCVTWSAEIIAVGWDFAESVLREQSQFPASRQNPVEVTQGRIRGRALRKTSERSAVARHSVAAVDETIPASATEWRPTASQVLAHECGHTWQALRLHSLYLPFVGAVTLFREGPHPWNYFENQASELGQFGGIVNGSVCKELMKAVARTS
jgi:hypothetical protein